MMNNEQMQKIVNTLNDIDRQIFMCKANLIDQYNPDKLSEIENTAFLGLLTFVNSAGRDVVKAVEMMGTFGFTPTTPFSDSNDIVVKHFIKGVK